MESTVGKLLDVDREARMMLDEAQQYYDKTVEEISGEKKRMREEYEQKSQKHLEDIRMAEAAATEDATAEIQQRYGRLTGAIDELYNQNHKKWEDGIYERLKETS